MIRRAARTDANKAAIVTALISIGAKVYDLRMPVDLLVLLDGRVHLVEIKDGGKSPSRRVYTPAQKAFIGDGWPVKTLYSVAEVLKPWD